MGDLYHITSVITVTGEGIGLFELQQCLCILNKDESERQREIVR